MLQMMGEQYQRFAFPIAVVAVVSIVYGALVALGQPNLKRRIAYTSVNHMGYTILGVSAGAAAIGLGDRDAQTLALTGAVVEMVAHGLITGALFLISGSIWQRGESYEIDDYSGLAARAPRMTAAAVVASFASLGLPGLAGFIAEFQIFVGTFAVYPWLAGIGLIGIVITAALFLQLLQRMFLGELPDRWSDWPDLGRVETASLAVLLVLVVAIGVYPRWLLSPIEAATRAMGA